MTQDPPRGTGDAVRVALGAPTGRRLTLVTNGDCPLLPAATLAALADVASGGHLAVLTARVPDPAGLGRIVRDGSGAVRAIVEDKDADPAATRDRRDQHRRAGGADAASAPLGRGALGRQCAA